MMNDIIAVKRKKILNPEITVVSEITTNIKYISNIYESMSSKF
jgi:hypothetical protein